MPRTSTAAVANRPAPVSRAKKPAKSSAARAPRAVKVQASRDIRSMPINEVWARYQKQPDEATRNYLWTKYLHLVRYIAERTSARLPDEVDVNDLMSAGQFGLMDAIDGFDLSRGVKFETFCAARIRGAILDELRSMDWVPRLVRSRAGKVSSVRQKFEMKEGRAPTQEELAEKLGVCGEEFDKVTRDSRAVGTVSLNRKCFSSDGNKDVTEIDILKDESQRNPFAETQRRDVKDLITRGLSRAERLIVVLYYYEEMTMKEIGLTLDLSESRVSQMHSSILQRLKAHLHNKEGELQPVKD